MYTSIFANVYVYMSVCVYVCLITSLPSRQPAGGELGLVVSFRSPRHATEALQVGGRLRPSYAPKEGLA